MDGGEVVDDTYPDNPPQLRRMEVDHMPRRWRHALALLVIAMLVGIPAAADDFTGSERELQTLPCPAEGEEVPPNQEPPEEGECGEEDETYEGYVWTNDVSCADGGTDVGDAATLYTDGDPTALAGGVGVCNDGDTVPLQGRIVAEGSDEGITVYADGDKDNEQEQAQGWARLDADSDGAEVRCGGEGGKMDASEPQPGDTQDNCG